jgi:hypothetical protein
MRAKATTKRQKATTKASDIERNLHKAIKAKPEARQALVKLMRLVMTYSDEKTAELACYQVLVEAVEDSIGHRPKTVTASAPRLSPSVHFASDKHHKYIARVPKRFDEPPVNSGPGWVLVHNHVRPHRIPAVRGFRAWWMRKQQGLEPCPCGWYDARGTHYRVAARFRQMGLGTEE